MWFIAPTSGGGALACEAEDGTGILFMRVSSGAVWGKITLSDSVTEKIDYHRLPLVWIDENLETDIGESASLDALMTIEDASMRMVIVEDKSVAWQAWHGKADEGAGVMWRLRRGSALKARIFLQPHKIIDAEFPLSGISLLITKVFDI